MEKIYTRAVFIYWCIEVKVTQAPGDQRPTQPNLSNVGHYRPTLLSNSKKNMCVCVCACVCRYANSALKDFLQSDVTKLNCSMTSHSFTHIKEVKPGGGFNV